MAASTEGVDGPKDGAGRDMSFDLVRRDIGFDATADTSGIPDSDSDELANGDVPNETVPQESAEVQDDVARNSPKTEQISHSSKVVDTASTPADSHEDNAPISDGSVKADSVEPDISVPSLEVPPTRIEVRLPSLPLDQRDDYEEVRSNIIEMVRREEFTDSGQACYYVDFTDGREEVVSHP